MTLGLTAVYTMDVATRYGNQLWEVVGDHGDKWLPAALFMFYSKSFVESAFNCMYVVIVVVVVVSLDWRVDLRRCPGRKIPICLHLQLQHKQITFVVSSHFLLPYLELRAVWYYCYATVFSVLCFPLPHRLCLKVKSPGIFTTTWLWTTFPTL